MNPFKTINHRLILWLVLIILLVLAILLSAFSIANTASTPIEWWSNWAQNVSTDMLGAILTYLLFELIIARRQRQEEEERENNRRRFWLIERLGSANNQEALRALDELSEKKWLYDGSLKSATLRDANLEGADLRQADFRDVDLRGAILKKANLMHANFSGAYLVGVDFEGAIDIDKAEYNEETRLPDKRYWQKHINMRVYIQPRNDLAKTETP